MYDANVLYIEDWSSRCGSCGKGCDPMEKYHDSWLGYDALHISDTKGIDYPLEGCHAEFKHVVYIGCVNFNESNFCENICNEIRPDLEYYG